MSALYTSGKICGFCGHEQTLAPTGRFVRHNAGEYVMTGRDQRRVWRVVKGVKCFGSGYAPEWTVDHSDLRRVECASCGKNVRVTNQRTIWVHKTMGPKWQPRCQGSGWHFKINIMRLEKNLQDEREEIARKTRAERQSDHDAATAGGRDGEQARRYGPRAGSLTIGGVQVPAAGDVPAAGAAGSGVPGAAELRAGGQDTAAEAAPPTGLSGVCRRCAQVRPCWLIERLGHYLCDECQAIMIGRGALSLNEAREAKGLAPFPIYSIQAASEWITKNYGPGQMQYRVLYALPTPSVNRRSPGDTQTQWQEGEWRDIHPDTHVGLAGGAKRLQFRRKPKRTDAEILAYLRSNYERMVSHRHDVTIWSKILRGEF